MILSPTPNSPLNFRVIESPNIGLFVEQSTDDRDYSFVMIEGQKWAIQNKQIKHFRRNNVNKINRSVQA